MFLFSSVTFIFGRNLKIRHYDMLCKYKCNSYRFQEYLTLSGAEIVNETIFVYLFECFILEVTNSFVGIEGQTEKERKITKQNF